MDKVVLTHNLNLEAEFVDGDTRTVTIPNPNTAIDLVAQSKNLGAYIKAHEVLIGDKAGAAFTRFRKGTIVRAQLTYLDLKN